MQKKKRLSTSPFIALVAGEPVLHVLRQMAPTVNVQSTLLPEGFAARLTDVRPLLAVYGLVSFQHFFVNERLAAVIAAEILKIAKLVELETKFNQLPVRRPRHRRDFTHFR